MKRRWWNHRRDGKKSRLGWILDENDFSFFLRSVGGFQFDMKWVVMMVLARVEM